MRRRIDPRLLITAALLAWVVAPLQGQDWPQLRGPGSDSRADAPALQDLQSIEFQEVWRQPFGSGYAAVSIVGDVAVTAASVDDHDRVRAFDARTGGTRWDFRLAPVFRGRDGSDDGPSSTPTIGDGKGGDERAC